MLQGSAASSFQSREEVLSSVMSQFMAQMAGLEAKVREQYRSFQCGREPPMPQQSCRSPNPIGCQSKGKVTPRGSDRALLHHMLWQMAILEGGVTDLREARNRKMAHGQSLERHCKPRRS